MAKFLQLTICCFAQVAALISILIGSGFVPQLTHSISAATSGQPWQVSELARLVACACGPILLGVFATLGLVWYVRSSFQLWQRKAAFPDQPWLWRADWEAKLVRLSNTSAIWFFVIATTSYLLIFLPLGLYLASLKNATMVYAFLGILALFLLFFIRLSWINRHRNRSTLQLETLPGLIAGRFSGIATIPLSFPKDANFQVKLRCEVTQSAHAKSRDPSDLVGMLTDANNGQSRSETRTETVYEDSKLVAPEESSLTPPSTSVRVAFEIPENLPSTGTITEVVVRQLRQNQRVTKFYCWSLRIRLSTESELREIVFEVPVFTAAK